MMLLIFTAGPMRQFRFGLYRHKYAQHLQWERTRETSQSRIHDRDGESVDSAAAEALCNRWRFFATYLAPQFSTVLRHPFLAP